MILLVDVTVSSHSGYAYLGLVPRGVWSRVLGSGMMVHVSWFSVDERGFRFRSLK